MEKIGHGLLKEYVSNYGFKVIPLRVVNTTVIKSGIYVCLCRPDSSIKEEKYFSFEQEAEAEKQFKIYVDKVKQWDKIKI